MVKMGLGALLGAESEATEPQSHETLYVCTGIDAGIKQPSPPRRAILPPVTDVHARVQETPSNINFFSNIRIIFASVGELPRRGETNQILNIFYIF